MPRINKKISFFSVILNFYFISFLKTHFMLWKVVVTVSLSPPLFLARLRNQLQSGVLKFIGEISIPRYQSAFCSRKFCKLSILSVVAWVASLSVILSFGALSTAVFWLEKHTYKGQYPIKVHFFIRKYIKIWWRQKIWKNTPLK